MLQFSIVPATASSSLLSPLNLGTLWVQPHVRSAPTSTMSSGPGGLVPAVLDFMGEIQHKNLVWDSQVRDHFGNAGFLNGFQQNYARRCLVPALRINYPDLDGRDHVGTFFGTERRPLWIAGTLHTTAGVETFSVLTAPRNELSMSTSAHEPVLLSPERALAWFNPSIDPCLLIRAPSILMDTSTFTSKAA